MLMTAGEVTELSAQRVDARARLAVRHAEGRTRIERLYQEGAAKIRMPEVQAGPLEAILINTAGGLTGGDRIAWEIDAGRGTSVTLTTQACEKLYRSRSGEARAEVRLSAEKGARIAWLPQETIVYDRSCFSRRLEVDLAEGARSADRRGHAFRPPRHGRKRVAGDVSRPLAGAAGRPPHPRRGLFHRPRPRGNACPACGRRAAPSPSPPCFWSRRAPRLSCPRSAKSSARKAGPASGTSAELASFLRGSSQTTVTHCASG